MNTSMGRPFRFGVVAAQAQDAADWARTARAAEDLGFGSLLVPDNLDGLSPFPALTAAATATTRLRVGSYVLAAPYRSPQDVAWQAASLDLLSGHRFELGLGAGRPAAAGEAQRLGRPFGSFADRVEEVARSISAARARTPGLPVLLAGSGERLLRLAAEHADTVALGLSPDSGDDALLAKVGRLRDLAGTRFDDIELNLNLLVVGDDTPPWLRRFVPGEVGSVAGLRGSVEQMAETLLRRRELCAVSYVVTSAHFMAALSPVVERLSGA